MAASTRTVAKWAVTSASFLWIAIVGWLQITAMFGTDMQTHSSDQVQQRLSDCSGTFRQRYECKEAIVLGVQRSSAWLVLARLLLIIGPPLGAAVAFAYLMPKPKLPPRRPRKPKTAGTAEDDADDEDPDVWLERTRMQMEEIRANEGPVKNAPRGRR
ncbi:MAG: hypothetical protein H7840_12300 [Alphaproteobacteria bacterium]